MTKTNSLRLHLLLKFGYFPIELPPEFSTVSFADKINQINWQNSGNYLTKFERYSQSRAGHRRRVLGIPNPVSQYFLSKCLVENWSKIRTFINRSTLSKSKPVFDASGTRAIKITSLGHLSEERVKAINHSRYILRSDISRYYPTLYSHSIPWAVHTKTIAKANRGITFYGNLIDTLVRNGQDG